jgi:phospholipid/cholesterol/gamma-HCH transport system substrate-binding protein
MSTRAAGHEVRVGLVAVVALAGLIVLLIMAGDGPGFLTARREIEVDFRDGQGIRPGSPVRIAGIDAGRVTDVILAEVDGTLKARVTIAVPVDLVAKLKQDVKITIQASLTGQSRINIVSSGKSNVGLVAGQVVQGVETTFFDPILEQVGLGPVERSHLSHTISEIRDTVDKAGPRKTRSTPSARRSKGRPATSRISPAGSTPRPLAWRLRSPSLRACRGRSTESSARTAKASAARSPPSAT